MAIDHHMVGATAIQLQKVVCSLEFSVSGFSALAAAEVAICFRIQQCTMSSWHEAVQQLLQQHNSEADSQMLASVVNLMPHKWP